MWTLVADASVLDWYPYGESSLLPVFKMTGVLHVGKHRLLHASLQLLVVAASCHGTQRISVSAVEGWCLCYLSAVYSPHLLRTCLLLLRGSGFTVFAGLRRLMFKQEAVSTTQPEHFFKYKAPAAGPSALGLDQPNLTAKGLVDVVPSQHTVRAKDQAAKGPAVKHSMDGLIAVKATAA